MKCFTRSFRHFWANDGVVTYGKIFSSRKYASVQETILARRGAYVAEEIAGIDDNVIVSINPINQFINLFNQQINQIIYMNCKVIRIL